jgi:hypothetical protein
VREDQAIRGDNNRWSTGVKPLHGDERVVVVGRQSLVARAWGKKIDEGEFSTQFCS